VRQAMGRARAHVRRTRGLLSPVNVRGAGVELVWTATHAALYPLGLVREKVREVERFTLDGLTPVQRGLLLGDVEAAGTPIVLVHGWVDNRSIFTLLRRQLRRRGFGRIVNFQYSVFHRDIASAARLLGAAIERLCDETGYERVHVVGHSLGGVIARYYVQRLGGDQRVHTLATLGTPHSGTLAAHVALGTVVRQLRPKSPIITDLAGPAAGCQTRFLAIYSDLDQLVIPKESARLEHPDLMVRNVLRCGVGHLSLPIDGRAVHEIVTTFAHLGSDGTTLTPGVTSIEGDIRHAALSAAAAIDYSTVTDGPRRCASAHESGGTPPAGTA
jgi:triacylglycerol lipase